MKKLNKKGFTLIELLAVIVVLAIVLVVTIPSVLSSMGSAKEKQFENALATITEYYKKNCEAAAIGDKNLADYNDTLFTVDSNGKCSLKTGKTSGDVIIAAGYSYKTECNDESDICGGVTMVTGTGEILAAKSSSKSKFGSQCFTNPSQASNLGITLSANYCSQ